MQYAEELEILHRALCDMRLTTKVMMHKAKESNADPDLCNFLNDLFFFVDLLHNIPAVVGANEEFDKKYFVNSFLANYHQMKSGDNNFWLSLLLIEEYANRHVRSVASAA